MKKSAIQKDDMHEFTKDTTWTTAFAWIIYILLMTVVVMITGCGTLPNGRKWGEDATLQPGWQRFSVSAKKAALDPETWIPVAGAVILQIDDMDHRLSDWASDHTPLFGSQDDAGDGSDDLRAITNLSYVITALATPSGAKKKEWAYAKTKGFLVGGASLLVTHYLTDTTKDLTDRTRPDETSDRSFPSAHASNASASATLAARNLESLDLAPKTRKLMHIGFKAVAATTAWARVEAKRHYPSDVLVGYALGHFLAAVFNDTFLGLEDPKEDVMISVEPSKEGVVLGLRWVY